MIFLCAFNGIEWPETGMTIQRCRDIFKADVEESYAWHKKEVPLLSLRGRRMGLKASPSYPLSEGEGGQASFYQFFNCANSLNNRMAIGH